MQVGEIIKFYSRNLIISARVNVLKRTLQNGAWETTQSVSEREKHREREREREEERGKKTL